jgi:hypothetical protein
MAGPVKWVVQVNSGDVRYADGDQAGKLSFQDTLKTLREKRRAFGLARPVAAITAVGVLAALAIQWPIWLTALLAVTGGMATWLVHERDQAHRMAIMLYEMDRNVKDAFSRLVRSGRSLAECSGRWHVVPATIGGGTDRTALSMHFAAPPFLVTNVETFAFDWGGHTMHFFPDRVLVYEAANARAISYRQLKTLSRTIALADENTPPDDAKIVGRTWRHALPDGKPDPEHPINRELPLCEYGEIEFTGPDGLHEVVQFSRLGAAHEFTHALRTVASLVPDSA